MSGGGSGHDLSLRGVGIGVAVILAGIFFSLAMAWAVVAASRANSSGANQPVPRARQVVRGPVLESAPQQELRKFLSEKRSRLNGYGWIDRASERVHIPVGLAMQLLEERAAKSGAKQP